MRIFYCFLFFCSLSISAITQTADFEHLNAQNGLSQNSVLAITQDKMGFMWFGTQYGLNKYDSRNFRVYRHNPSNNNSISSDYILSLLYDSHQTLWVGTLNGLNKYIPEKETFEQISTGKKNGTGDITCIYEDKKGNIWTGSSNGLNVLIDRAKNIFRRYTVMNTHGLLSGDAIHCIFEDEENNLWVGTATGLTKMVIKGDRIQYQNFRHDVSNPNSISENNITSIAEDNYHNIWVGTSNEGLNLYNKATGSFTVYQYTAHSNGLINNNIRKIIPGLQGQLWIGTQEGISILNPLTQQFTSYQNDPDNKKSLSQNSIHSLFMDNNHTVWIGTFFGGLNYTNSVKTVFTVYQKSRYYASISNNVISSIVEDNNNLWIGTEGGGLNCMNKKRKTIVSYQHKPYDQTSISSNLIKTIYPDRQGNLWIGTHGGGLNLFNPNTKTFRRYFYDDTAQASMGTEIVALMEDKEGRFWMGTQKGLRIYQRHQNVLEPYTRDPMPEVLSKIQIRCLLRDAKDNCWIATNSGLYRKQNNSNKITDILLPQPGSPVNINCLFEDAKGLLWIGTYYSGLLKYNTTSGELTAYTQNDGLPNNNVLAVSQDENGYIWASTSNGLARLDPQKNSFKIFSTDDGIAGNEFNKNAVLRASDGELFFGGVNGLTGFFPKDITENNRKPAAFITGFRLFNQSVETGSKNPVLPGNINLTRKITLQYNQNVFTIDFAVLNYLHSAGNRYAYQIKGVDKDWNYTSIPSATFTNLPPGQYHFLAKGANNDGVWSDPVLLIINVSPPWWLSWWAYTLYFLAVGAVAFLIIRFFFLQALLKKDKELTALKLTFFTNISHEIRTYLSLIIGPVEKLLSDKEETNADTLHLTTIQKNSNDLLHLVNELMDFRKAETGNLTLHVSQYDMVPFIRSIHQSFQDVSLSKNIMTDFISSSEKTALYFDKEQMKKVLFNLLSNAYKFTHNGGHISITIDDKEDNTVSVRVADNGKGISPENIHKLFDNYFQENDYGKQDTGYGIGLALSKSIVGLHKGSLTVESNHPGSETSTVFTVTLKKGRAHFTKDQVVPEEPSPDDFPAPRLTHEAPPAFTGIKNAATHTGQKRYSLLIVEDNAEVRKFITHSLSGLYQLYEAENGLAGFTIATEHIPDLIISDVMMPEMDGFMMCQKIKTDERTNHIPVILLTAKTSVANQISGLRMGADVYLTKPFSMQLLELQIQNQIASIEKIKQRYSQQITAFPIIDLSPEEPTDENTGSPENKVTGTSFIENEFLSKIVSLVEQNFDNTDFNVEMICRKIGMSQTVLYKKTKSLTGMTIHEIVKSVRLKKAAELIAENKYAVYEVAGMIGYNDTKYFSREFKKQFGISPRDYNKNAS